MRPDEQIEAVLATALDEAILRWSPNARRSDVDDRLLRAYSNEEASLLGTPELAADGPALGVPACWKATAPGRTARHFIVASINDYRLSEGQFPEVLRCCARLRSHLSTAEQIELAIILVVARPSAGQQADYHGFHRVERNESFARVYLWQLDSVPKPSQDSARELMERMHLGQGAREASGPGVDLSPAQSLFHDSELTSEQVVEWRQALSAQLSPKERADRLLEALEPVPGGQDGQG
jgi:hypothetical protein